MGSRLCLLTNYNLYESKRHFTEGLAAALRRAGAEVLVLDAEEHELGGELLSRLKAFSPDLTCSFNSFEPAADGRCFWDHLHLPHLALLVDPAYYSLNLLKSPLAILATVDREDCQFLRMVGAERSLFLPHAIAREELLPPIEWRQERRYPVVFIGSCYDYESVQSYWKATFPQVEQRILEEAVATFWQEGMPPLAIFLQKVASAHGLSLSYDSERFQRLFYCFDYSLRGRERVALLRALNHVEVHLFGGLYHDQLPAVHGWDYYLRGKENIALHPPVRYADGLEILAESCISLNSVPTLPDGSHERLLASFAKGALPVTGENRYAAECFAAGEELLFFDAERLNALEEELQVLLISPERRMEMARRGYAKVESNHCWEARIATLEEQLPPLLATCTNS